MSRYARYNVSDLQELFDVIITMRKTGGYRLYSVYDKNGVLLYKDLPYTDHIFELLKEREKSGK